MKETGDKCEGGQSDRVCVCVCVCVAGDRWSGERLRERRRSTSTGQREEDAPSTPTEKPRYTHTLTHTHSHTLTHSHTHSHTSAAPLSGAQASSVVCCAQQILPLNLPQVHNPECVGEEGRRSQSNHGYHTRAAVEETSRESADVADDDDSTSEVLPVTTTTHGQKSKLIDFTFVFIHKIGRASCRERV